MKRVTVIEGQTTWDIALQEYGSIEGFFWVVDDNPDVFDNLNVILQAGMVLNVRDEVINQDMVTYLAKNKIRPVNGLNQEQMSLIAFDFHEEDFDNRDFHTETI